MYNLNILLKQFAAESGTLFDFFYLHIMLSYHKYLNVEGNVERRAKPAVALRKLHQKQWILF